MTDPYAIFQRFSPEARYAVRCQEYEPLPDLRAVILRNPHGECPLGVAGRMDSLELEPAPGADEVALAICCLLEEHEGDHCTSCDALHFEAELFIEAWDRNEITPDELRAALMPEPTTA